MSAHDWVSTRLVNLILGKAMEKGFISNAPYPLSRESSQLSNTTLTFCSTISSELVKTEDVAAASSTQLPITPAFPDLNTPYSITYISNALDGNAGTRSTVLIPVARLRPRRYVVNLEREMAEWRKLDANRSIPIAVKPVHPLTAYVTKPQEILPYDFQAWIDCIEYNEKVHDRFQDDPKPIVPRLERQCKEYYLTKNFNALVMHPWRDFKEEEAAKNRDEALLSVALKKASLDARHVHQAYLEHGRRTQARNEQALRAQARTAKTTHRVEAARAARIAQFLMGGHGGHDGAVAEIPRGPILRIDRSGYLSCILPEIPGIERSKPIGNCFRLPILSLFENIQLILTLKTSRNGLPIHSLSGTRLQV